MPDYPVTVIRPSSLPSWGDCCRRSVARVMRYAPQRQSVRSPLDSQVRHEKIATAFGTVVHGVVSEALENDFITLNDEGWVKPDDMARHWADQFRKTPTILWDRTTRNLEDAKWQSLTNARAIICWLREQNLTAAALSEAELSTPLSSITNDPRDHNTVLRGTLDLLTECGALVDYKTGVKLEADPVQLASYAYNAMQNEYTVSRLIHLHVPRDTAVPSVLEYDLTLALQSLVRRLGNVAELTRSLPRRTEEEVMNFTHEEREAFDAERNDWLNTVLGNLRSSICSAKYCDLHGTVSCLDTHQSLLISQEKQP